MKGCACAVAPRRRIKKKRNAEGRIRETIHVAIWSGLLSQNEQRSFPALHRRFLTVFDRFQGCRISTVFARDSFAFISFAFSLLSSPAESTKHPDVTAHVEIYVLTVQRQCRPANVPPPPSPSFDPQLRFSLKPPANGCAFLTVLQPLRACCHSSYVFGGVVHSFVRFTFDEKSARTRQCLRCRGSTEGPN